MHIATRMVRLGVLASALAVAACGGESEPASESTGAPGAAPSGAAPAGGAAAPMAANLPAGVTQEMVTQGQQIFHGNGICFTCHGQNGQGAPPLGPNLTDSEWLWITPGPDAYEQLVQQITTGTPQPKQHQAPMPPKGGAQLSEEQVRAVAAYVYSLGGIQGG